MKRAPSRFGLASALALSVLNLTAAPLKIELPAEIGVFKTGQGVEIANGQCLVCHSVEYVATQPQFPRVFWASSVKKMREKYGSAIPEDQVELLLDYLTTQYGVVSTNHPTTNASSATLIKPLIDRQKPSGGEAIATQYGCLGCHNVTVKLVGPPYKEIAAKYRNDADAFGKVAEQIRKGGSGKWGPIIMPPFPQVSPEETKALTDWILGRK